MGSGGLRQRQVERRSCDYVEVRMMTGLRKLATLGLQRIGRGLAPISEPAFRLYWVGQTVSAIGGSLMPVALAFATLQVAGSPSALGLVLGTGVTARLLLLPLGASGDASRLRAGRPSRRPVGRPGHAGGGVHRARPAELLIVLVPGVRAVRRTPDGTIV